MPRFLRAVYQLRQAGLAQRVQLGQTLTSWSEGIVATWRFTRNNGIAEGFHNKMELIQPASLRLPELRKLPTPGEGVMFLGIFGVWVCPRFWRRATI